MPLSNGPPLSLRSPDSVKQPRAAGSVGLSGGVWDGVKAIVLASPAHVCWRVGHLVLFEEKENCSSQPTIMLLKVVGTTLINLEGPPRVGSAEEG